MTTIGFRFEDERPYTPKSKRSLRQKLSQTHGTIISNFRFRKGEESQHRNRWHNERPHTSFSSYNNLSMTFSNASTRSSGLHWSMNEPDSYESDDDFEPPPTDIESLQYGELDIPFHYFTTPKERDGRRTTIRGMQSFVLWKQSSSNSAMTRPSYISPPCTPRSSHSRASSRAAQSEMSDEQIEEWLERPLNAEDHRRRKFSGCSANSRHGSSDRDIGRVTIDVIQEDQDETDSSASMETPRASMAYPISRDTAGGEHNSKTNLDKRNDSVTALTTDYTPKTHFMKDDGPKFLTLPDDLFDELAFDPENKSTKEFRLSCIRIYDKI